MDKELLQTLVFAKSQVSMARIPDIHRKAHLARLQALIDELQAEALAQ